MTALQAFDKSLQRANNILDLYDAAVANALTKTDGSELHNEALDDLLRAALVLIVSSMDAYFHAVFSNNLAPYLRKRGPNPALAKYLQDCGGNVEFLLSLFAKSRPFGTIRKKIDDQLFKKPLHNMGEVNDLFQKFKIQDLLQAVATRHGIQRQTLKNRIGKWVQRRHEIAHAGDLHRGKKKKYVSRAITEQEVRSALLGIKEFVEHSDASILAAIK